MPMIAQLRAARNYTDLGHVFGASAADLSSAIYGKSGSYTRFEIPKKSGGIRIIDCPNGLVRSLQGQLVPAFNRVYKPSLFAHGFIAKRSIVSNAAPHIGKRTLINLDLLDFFPSISFRRIRGLLLAEPFGFSWTVATILAQACTCRGNLPAGGITSPVLSNLVCKNLDRRLAATCSKLGGSYSRYADDITISFNRPLRDIPQLATLDGDGGSTPGALLEEIISGEGFSMNPAKFRIAERSQRKMAAGIVVNAKSNVRRTWLRKLENDIYAIEKFGISAIACERLPKEPPSLAANTLARKLHGKLAYLRMVRGEGDWIVSELASRFNLVSTKPRLKIPDTEIVSELHRASRPLLIVTAHDALHPVTLWSEQGTGFVRADGVIVTAAHVLMDDATGLVYPHLSVRRQNGPAIVLPCDLLKLDITNDLAFLRLRTHDAGILRSRFVMASRPNVGQTIHSFGYPNYSFNDRYSHQIHTTTSTNYGVSPARFSVSGIVAGGLSGAPVLDENMRVVGIVHRGLAAGGHANEIILSDEITRSYP